MQRVNAVHLLLTFLAIAARFHREGWQRLSMLVKERDWQGKNKCKHYASCLSLSFEYALLNVEHLN
jgi:hypothetical protein